MKVTLLQVDGNPIHLDTTEGIAIFNNDKLSGTFTENCESLTSFLNAYKERIKSFRVLVPFREIEFVKNETGDYMRTAEGEEDNKDFVPYAYNLEPSANKLASLARQRNNNN